MRTCRRTISTCSGLSRCWGASFCPKKSRVQMPFPTSSRAAPMRRQHLPGRRIAGTEPRGALSAHAKVWPMKRRRQATRRAWLISLLLAAPALVSVGIFFFERQLDLAPALLLGICLLIYIAFCASALVDTFVRPLQTLSNWSTHCGPSNYSRAWRRSRACEP